MFYEPFHHFLRVDHIVEVSVGFSKWIVELKNCEETISVLVENVEKSTLMFSEASSSGVPESLFLGATSALT